MTKFKHRLVGPRKRTGTIDVNVTPLRRKQGKKRKYRGIERMEKETFTLKDRLK